MSQLKFVILLCLGLIAAAAAAPHEGRIVGGADAYEAQFPHQVSLRRSGSHTCGASIISNNYVLTAAHCVTTENADGSWTALPAKSYSIRAGSTNRLSGGVVINVATITVHEKYGNFLNDVAVLLLETPLIYSQNIKPIALASAEVPTGVDVIISGWGRLTTKGSSPTKLQWNTLKSISKLQCMSKIGMYSDTLICLAHEANNGACNGDSGGPATYKGELVGVAGFVVDGCGSANPDGYAKVFYHIDWIKAHSDL